MVASISAGSLGLPALKAGEHEGAVRRDPGAGGVGDAVGLGNQQARPSELSAERHSLRHHVDADREHRQRAGLARELDPARGDRETGLVVPHHHGGGRREPAPAEDFLDRDVVAREAGRRLLENRRRGRAAVGERHRKAVQQQIGRTRSVGAAPSPPSPRARPRACRPCSQAPRRTAPSSTRRDRSRARAPDRAARASSQLEAAAPERRSRGSRSTRPRRAAGRDGRAGARPARPTSAAASSAARSVERARPQAGLGGGERPVGSSRRVAGQRDRALQERRRGGEAAARLRPTRRSLELERDLLVGTRRRRGQMPRTTIRIGIPVGRLRQRQMRRSALSERPRTGTPPSAPADGGRSRAPRAPATRRVAASTAETSIPRRSDARQSSSGSPTGSAAATSSSSRDVLRERLEPADVALLDPAAGARARRAPRTHLPAPSRSPRAAAPAAPAGCPASPR